MRDRESHGCLTESHVSRPYGRVREIETRPSPAGHWPIDARYPHVTVAGCSLHCGRCGTEGRAPSPRDPGYDEAVLLFLAEHKHPEAA